MGKSPEASLALTNMGMVPSFTLWKRRTGRNEDVEKKGMENESVERSLMHKYVEILEDLNMLEQKDSW